MMSPVDVPAIKSIDSAVGRPKFFEFVSIGSYKGATTHRLSMRVSENAPSVRQSFEAAGSLVNDATENALRASFESELRHRDLNST